MKKVFFARALMVIEIIAVAVTVFGTSWFIGLREHPLRAKTLLVEDLPKGATLLEHIHAETLTDTGEERAEMHHYATEEAKSNGGPIYGVYGYSIVSIEYEILASSIDERPVGESNAGNILSGALLRLAKTVPYDHFHIGESVGTIHSQPVYRIHFMLLPHETEMALGLRCG